MHEYILIKVADSPIRFYENFFKLSRVTSWVRQTDGWTKLFYQTLHRDEKAH